MFFDVKIQNENMDLSIYNGKKILILGLGREGVDSLRFFLDNCPKNEIGIADSSNMDNLSEPAKNLIAKNPDIKTFLGENYLLSLESYDVVVKTPGIPIHLPEIEQAYARGKITSQTEIFFNLCPGIIVGITGTKGKSTTSSITCAILKRGGAKVQLLGNIGTPMLSYLDGADKESIFVCELSAHQLYNLKKSPHIAVILNIYQEHLDYYNNFREYIRSKANIAIHQSKEDCLIYDSGNLEVKSIASESLARKIAFNEYSWNYAGKTKLIGKFNLENAKVGAIIGRIIGVGDNDINAAIAEFEPLDNRLEFIGNFFGIDCYNDSLSTIQESAVAAIQGLGDRVETLIAGGFDRGQPFEKLAEAVLKGKINTLILFPVTGQRIWREIEKKALVLGENERLAQIGHYFTDNMDKAVDLAIARTGPGRICLLSAASASFNGFKDYADRGDKFKQSLAKINKPK